MVDDSNDNDEWTLWWDAHIEALERILGPCHEMIGHATIPFDIGSDLSGAADIVYFHKHIDGIVSVTSELIGRDDQQHTQLGNYELAVAHRDDSDWGPDIISQLAHYTCESAINPNETMGIGEATPDGSTIAALLFSDYGRFKVRGRECGLLMCTGITAEELRVCRNGDTELVLNALRDQYVYPFTDLARDTVV